MSERSIYTYIEKGRLPATYEKHLIVLETAVVRRFRRQAAGRPRVRQPEWHRSSAENAQVLTTISVAVREGQTLVLHQYLKQLNLKAWHLLPGTIARYIAREPGVPPRLRMVLIWRKDAMPPEEERLAALARIWEDLDHVLDWEHVVFQECEMVLHT